MNRETARHAYARGDLDRAAAAQAAVLVSGTGDQDDILFMGLILHALGQPNQAIAVLRQGLRTFPASAALHENLAVTLLAANQPEAAISAALSALGLGSDSPNLQDCLCESFERLGRIDRAMPHGRQALEAKDRRFGAGPILAAIPTDPPPPLDPEQRNVIAYSLWGNADRYRVPLLENARLLPHLFPGWSMRVYHDESVDPAYLGLLAALGVDLRIMPSQPDLPQHRKLLWRFDPIADPSVQRFLIRDADSLLTVKERVAVDDWLASDRYFHTMRDYVTHTDLVLAGMWGGVGGILPDVGTLLEAYTGWRMETAHVDQDLLTQTVWPSIRESILIHDSVFAPCLGSVKFPPFGALPAGHHIGQNAFLSFRRSG